MRSAKWLILPLLAVPVAAQRGDRPGERQSMLPESVSVPSAKALAPADELRTFTVAEGYEVRLYAAEPLVQDPVVGSWDAAGRLWVCEFRSYMKDLDATDEDEPSGRIVVLHDDDRDGVADRSTVFADGLVLPRAVLPMLGGALAIVPPNLVWFRDADGDLVADGAPLQILGGFEAGTANPEHSGNGLTFGLDGRIHLCNDRRMLRPLGRGEFAIEQGAGGGQWGLAMDDRGRFYFNYNSDWLHCDLVPGRYGPLAAPVGGLPQLNHRVVREQSVWPVRMTPGINRGYQPHMLREDYTLARTTGVCGPVVYRGGLLPCAGDVFVCEPCGNVVRRFTILHPDGVMAGRNPYESARREFLASTDERFRPVNLMNGPDGALYVVDMYRGLIQHRNYVTSYLRQQVERRGLERPIHRGRIWRIVPSGPHEPPPMPQLVAAAVAPLVAALAHPSGTVRDLALQQLVEGRRKDAIPALRRQLGRSDRPAVQIATLAALAGLDALSITELRRFVRSEDSGVVAFVLQHAGGALARGDAHLWAAIRAMHTDTPRSVRWHAALAIGDALRHDDLRAERVEDGAVRQLARLVALDPGDGRLRAAVATAAHPRLMVVVRTFADAHRDELPPVANALVDFCRRAVRSRDPEQQRQVLRFAAEPACPGWQAAAALRGAVQALPKGNRRRGWLRFESVPPALVALSGSDDAALQGPANVLLGAVRVGGEAQPGAVADLTDEERQRVAAGATVFRGACAACHQLDGKGQRGLAPPLADSEWVTGPASRLIRIALHGVRGPIEVDGEVWELEMPGQAHLSERELAQVLSYLRRAFGHRATCIEERDVRRVKARTARRASAWTQAELERIR